jgi:1-acyl-sn-glycerol-3-phosphate acyltransferase
MSVSSPDRHGLRAAIEAGPAPPRWQGLFRLFRWYARRYAAKHLHAVRVAKSGPPPVALDGPTIVVMNHPSWWDPLLCFILSGLWPDRLDWGPIESKGLQRYRFLERVGLFGIATGTTRGAVTFLRIAKAILSDPKATLWVTAQGRFTDVRERPVRLRSGVGHLAESMDCGQLLPLAVEYVFWDERTPEALVYFGKPIDLAREPKRPAHEWTATIERALERAQDESAGLARRRDPALFTTLVQGRAGVGGVYDWGRRLRAWWRGERFRAEHGH